MTDIPEAEVEAVARALESYVEGSMSDSRGTEWRIHSRADYEKWNVAVSLAKRSFDVPVFATYRTREERDAALKRLNIESAIRTMIARGWTAPK